MPLYRYCPARPPCKLCGDGFDHHAPASAPALTDCPTCGQAVSRANVTAAHTPRLLKPLSVTAAKSAGFTILKRTSSGEYEKQ